MLLAHLHTPTLLNNYRNDSTMSSYIRPASHVVPQKDSNAAYPSVGAFSYLRTITSDALIPFLVQYHAELFIYNEHVLDSEVLPSRQMCALHIARSINGCCERKCEGVPQARSK